MKWGAETLVGGKHCAKKVLPMGTKQKKKPGGDFLVAKLFLISISIFDKQP